MSKVHLLRQSLDEAISYTLGEEQRTGLHAYFILQKSVGTLREE